MNFRRKFWFRDINLGFIVIKVKVEVVIIEIECVVVIYVGLGSIMKEG